MAKKVDGVIEAVRYNRNGKIEVARGYELRGVTYSDHILFTRETLLERLKDGKNFKTGQRIEFWASTFDLGKPLKVVSKDGKDYVTTGNADMKRDKLEDIPAF